jgi:hypothetical protein
MVTKPVGVIRRQTQSAMAVGSAQLSLRILEEHREIGGHGRVHRVLHGDLDTPTHARAFALVERRHDGRVEVSAAQEVGKGGARLDRWSVGPACQVHGAAGGLDRQVHGQPVTVGPPTAVARRARVDQTRMGRAQHVGPDPQAIHHTGRIVLEHDIELAHELNEHAASFRMLEVQSDAALVAIEHGQRQ